MTKGYEKVDKSEHDAKEAQDAGQGNADDINIKDTSKTAYAAMWKDYYNEDGGEMSPRSSVTGSNVTRSRRLNKSDTASTALVYSIEEDEENLGDDFESTPWIPPSVEKAKAFKQKNIFRGADVNINSITVVSAPDLGAGVTLYFKFAFTMTIALFFMTFLAIPALVIYSSGTRIIEQDRDIFDIYLYTLGNMGETETASVSSCEAASNSTILIPFGSIDLSVGDAASVLTAFEFVQIAIFFLFVWYIHSKVYSVEGKKKDTSISDYSIMVRDIPPDTTSAEIIKHFSDLYQLSSPDWRERPAVEGARPVRNVENSGDSIHKGTWIAECIIHKKIGTFISAFKDKQHLMEKLYRARAQMKMFAENSSHARGHNLRRFTRAEKAMLKAAENIDKLTEKNMKKQGLKVISDAGGGDGDEEGYKNSGGAGSETARTNKSIYRNIDADATTAFIVFEYCESFARCMDDSKRYSSFPASLFYPNELKFKGVRLGISKAPEPDQIVWENLEIKNKAKIIRRSITLLFSVLVVIVCFIIILQASIMKANFEDEKPSAILCDTFIPQLYSNASCSIDVAEMVLTRPTLSTDIAALDAQCEALIPGTFFARYAINGDETAIVGTYDVQACTQASADAAGYPVGGLCPVYNQDVLCPCISATDSTQCQTTQCVTDGASSPNCLSFPASNIGSCFCLSELNEILTTSDSVAQGLSEIERASSGTCEDFYVNYSLSVGLTYLSVGITVIMSTALRALLIYLSKKEFHSSGDREQGAVMSKIFLSSYAIMAIIVLIAYGTANDLPTFFKDLQIFNGPYDDFSPSWYGNLGFYFVSTFVISSYSPLVFHLLVYFIGNPLLQFLNHAQVRAKSSYGIVMQQDLNLMEVGPVFDATKNTAQLLALLFVAMTFAPGLPLMMPLAFSTFLLYFNIDKLLICRYYQKPPQVGDAAMKVVVQFLPYAGMMRLAFACWMFSNTEMIPISEFEDTPSNYQDLLDSLKDSLPSFLERCLRPNTFPLFVLLLITLGIDLVGKLWKKLPVYWVLKFVRYTIKHLCLKSDVYTKGGKPVIHPFDILKKKDVNRQESAPFSERYFQYLKHKDEIPDSCVDMCAYGALTQLDEREIEEGWEIADMGDYVIKVKVFPERVKTADGTWREMGEHKKTFEMIGDFRCNSYNVERVPAYRMAIQGLRAGTQSMMEYQNRMKEQAAMGVAQTESYEEFVHEKVRRSSIVEGYMHGQKELRKSILESGDSLDPTASGDQGDKRGGGARGAGENADEEEEDEDEEEGGAGASALLGGGAGAGASAAVSAGGENGGEKAKMKKKKKPKQDKTLASAIARAKAAIAVNDDSDVPAADGGSLVDDGLYVIKPDLADSSDPSPAAAKAANGGKGGKDKATKAEDKEHDMRMSDVSGASDDIDSKTLRPMSPVPAKPSAGLIVEDSSKRHHNINDDSAAPTPTAASAGGVPKAGAAAPAEAPVVEGASAEAVDEWGYYDEKGDYYYYDPVYNDENNWKYNETTGNYEFIGIPSAAANSPDAATTAAALPNSTPTVSLNRSLSMKRGVSGKLVPSTTRR